MKKVSIYQLQGLEKFPYDLYNEEGNLLYSKEDLINPGLLMQLSFGKFYRKDDLEMLVQKNENAPQINNVPEEEPLQMKETVITDDIQSKYKYDGKVDYVNYFTVEPVNSSSNSEFISILPQEQQYSLITSAKKLIIDTKEGRPFNIEKCETLSTSIIQQVFENIKKTSSVCNLRVLDQYTFSHFINVCTMCASIGITFNFSEKALENLCLAAILYDIGKVKIPEDILYKPGKLSSYEFERVKQHSYFGYKLIQENANLPDIVSRAAIEHHENLNGSGYPRNLKNGEISIISQIIKIVDVYDALISNRVYSQPITSDAAFKIMFENKKEYYSEQILDILFKLVNTPSKVY